jgi:MoxR-like ATPase
MSAASGLEQQFEKFRTDLGLLRESISQVVVGQQETIDAVLTALVVGGHVLIEGAPGLGKTLLARTVADVLDLDFRRIQFTSDLMPADVLGTYVVMEVQGKRKFEFQQGPVFTNVLLADEINRATPKTQAALLEALGEGAATVANETYALPEPFFVLATQSPEGGEGTFPLPQTQLDRFFFKVKIGFPSAAELETLLERTTDEELPAAKTVLDRKRLLEMTRLVRQVLVAPEVRSHAVRMLLATHPASPTAVPLARRFVEQGAGPRGAQAMLLAAKVNAVLDKRVHVSRDDLRRAALPALRHRIVLNYDGHAEQIDPDTVVREVMAIPDA